MLAAIVAAEKRAKAVRQTDVDPRPERTKRLEEGDKPAGETVGDLLDKFVARYVDKDAGLRSSDCHQAHFRAAGEAGHRQGRHLRSAALAGGRHARHDRRRPRAGHGRSDAGLRPKGVQLAGHQ